MPIQSPNDTAHPYLLSLPSKEHSRFENVSLMSNATDIRSHHVLHFLGTVKQNTFDLEICLLLRFVALGHTALTVITVAVLLVTYPRQHLVGLAKHSS